jgi:hypothetical protein
MKREFDEAIHAHINWLVRFETVLNGINREYFNPDQVGNDKICDFGRWLHANPTAFRNAEDFEQIDRLHRNFHAKASDIASMFNSPFQSDIIRSELKKLENQSGQLIDALYTQC